jgi:hypothetical protein
MTLGAIASHAKITTAVGFFRAFDPTRQTMVFISLPVT